ncbi:MAG TPA: hypothetical protein VJI12_03065 [archaeon]|nr:hypothetical protein [archaeon]
MSSVVRDFDKNGWFDRLARSSPLRWHLDSLMPFTLDYMYTPMMVIEHDGINYIIERRGPAKIAVRGVHNANGERLSQEDYSFFRFADSDVIGCQITQVLEKEAVKQGYKWRSDDQLSFLTSQSLYGWFEDIEERVESRL